MCAALPLSLQAVRIQWEEKVCTGEFFYVGSGLSRVMRRFDGSISLQRFLGDAAPVRDAAPVEDAFRGPAGHGASPSYLFRLRKTTAPAAISMMSTATAPIPI